ncbi:hypothetical protein RAJCM14343_0873 [Rhodococcus aetherivorans]|uniref:Uncharacterized protein n=1 Tax=Rhodococcus aetherivorans TaxID=191292 RepID=A0ABQ0YGK1_9NOCA|nr:hypothetical protein RAJCM14343_0873 [Rhodococcus aetherivorans]
MQLRQGSARTSFRRSGSSLPREAIAACRGPATRKSLSERPGAMPVAVG